MPAPEKLIIDTPEQIALEFALAGVGSRFLALALDTLIQAGAFLCIGALALLAGAAGLVFGAGLGVWGAAIAILLAFVLYYGYFAAFEVLWNGQTPGKRWIGLRVISETGRPMGAFDACLRNLLRIVDQLPAIYAVGILAVFLTAKNQRLGDLAAGTVVVHDRPAERPAFGDSKRISSTRYGAGRLTPDEVAAIEIFLRRRASLDDSLRGRTARDLVARIRPRLTLAPEAHPGDETLLEHVLTEYREGHYR